MHALPVVMACFFWSVPAEPKVTFRESCDECAEDEGCFQKGAMVKCARLPKQAMRRDEVSCLVDPQLPGCRRRRSVRRWHVAPCPCWGGSACVKDGAESYCLPMIAPPGAIEGPRFVPAK